jgi:NADH-quinone oxidoreductase subunit J
VVQSANPIYSVLFLILAYFNASGLALLSGHDYLAVLFIVLYVGAMCTFFLFTIMILDIRIEQEFQKQLFSKRLPINMIVAIGFALASKNLLHFSESSIVLVNIVKPITGKYLDTTTQIYSLGAVLYTTFAWHLLLSSFILLAAILGTIVLTLNKTISQQQQVIYEQNLVDYK